MRAYKIPIYLLSKPILFACLSSRHIHTHTKWRFRDSSDRLSSYHFSIFDSRCHSFHSKVLEIRCRRSSLKFYCTLGRLVHLHLLLLQLGSHSFHFHYLWTVLLRVCFLHRDKLFVDTQRFPSLTWMVHQEEGIQI